VDASKIQEWTKMKTRAGAQRVINRLIDLGILAPSEPEKTYGRTYEYSSYLHLFQKDDPEEIYTNETIV
jgi:hypothetical protein